jgi:peptide/nickel transport system substrate-binding protein
VEKSGWISKGGYILFMRYLKATWVGLLAFLVAMFITGATSEAQQPRRGGALNVALWQSFQTLDWQSTTAHPTPHGMMSVYEGLFALGKDLRPVPELAESYSVSNDKMTWTFSLRRGVLFHNGREMTADDVKASLERWKNVSPRGVQLRDLKEVRMVDKYTVQLIFNNPMGLFLLLVLGDDSAKAIIMPKEIAEASPKGGSLTEFIGTGPYQFVEYRPDNFLRLRRFENYVARTDPPNYQGGRKVAYPDFIVYWIVPEASTRVAGLEAGDYDIIDRVPDTEFGRLKDQRGLEPVINPPPVVSAIYFNQKKGLFTNIDMRRAIQALVNVEEVARSKVASKEFWSLNPSIYSPPSAYGTDEGSEYYNQANVEKAKEFLRKAGYRGEPVKFLVLRPEPTIYRACIAVSEQMKAAGINVNFLVYDLATWVAKRADPDEMDMFITEGFQVDPSLWQTPLGGRWPSDKVAFSSAETDEIFTQLALEVDFQKRFELGKKLQRLTYEKVAFVPVGWHFRLKAKKAQVRDPEGNISIGNTTLHNVWLDR